MSEFELLLQNAKNDDPGSINEMLNMFKPLITELSTVNGIFDDELHQILMIKFWTSIKKF